MYNADLSGTAIITIFTDFDVHLTTTSRSARRSERTLLPRTWAVARFRGTLEMLSNTVSACSMHSSRKAISLPIAPLSQFRQLKSQVQNRVRPTPRLEYFRKPDIAPLHSYIDTWFAPAIHGVVALVKSPLHSWSAQQAVPANANTTRTEIFPQQPRYASARRNCESSESPSGEQFCRMLFCGHQRFVLVLVLMRTGSVCG